MRLDAAALKSLLIFQKSNNDLSLYKMLNHCKTAIGARLLKRYLLQPLQNE